MSINLSINKNNYYCIRFRVHKRLIPFFKKILIRKSLQTKNKRIAQQKANIIYSKYEELLNLVRLIPSDQIQELTDSFIQNQLVQDKTNCLSIGSIPPATIIKTVTINEAYNKFCTWYKQQKITDKQYMATTHKLQKTIIPFFGANTSIEDITLETIEENQEFLTSFPNVSFKRYKNLTFNQITNLSNVPLEDMITTNTQIKYLKILKQFFNFTIKADILRYNPCTLITMPNNSISHREPFNGDDIKQLFTLFDDLDDRKYIYYTLAYTGMRPSEFWMCSISTCKDGIKYFDLTSKELKLKTSSSHRKIPLHKRLLLMNIDRKLPYLQEQFTQAGISTFFNKSIKPQITDNSNKIMYSFRHTVATELKRADVHMDKVSELLGHIYSNSSMTKEVYAQGYTNIQLQDAINQLVL